MSKNKKDRRQHRKDKKMLRQNYQNAKRKGWECPESDNCIVYVGYNNTGKYVVDGNVTQKQIDFLKSKESVVQRNNNTLHIDDIIIEARKPISLFQHKTEYESVTIPYMLAHFGKGPVTHPEVQQNNLQELFQSEIYRTSLLEYIHDDRILRENVPMADMSPTVAVTLKDNKITRIEFYVGHNALHKYLDLRSPDLDTQILEDSFVSEYSYDVAKNEYWIASMLGIKLQEFNEMQEVVHEVLFANYCKIIYGMNHTIAA